MNAPQHPPMPIFRAGRHTDGSGTTVELSAADLQAMAAAYDPALHEAPLVVGHPATDAPAYGWIGGLTVDDDGVLLATPRQVEPSFADLVEAGRYKKKSAALYPPDHPHNPKPGTWYLKHVGFLGAVPPALKGLGDAHFAADEVGVVTVAFANELPSALTTLVSLLRGLRDHLIAKEGVEVADRVLPSWDLDYLTRLAAESRQQDQNPLSSYSEAVMPDQKPPATPAAPDPQTTPATQPATPPTTTTTAQFAERETALRQREAAVAAMEAKLRREQSTAFLDGLIGAGRFAPGLKADALAFMERLGDDVDTVSFGEGGAGVAKLTPLAAFKALLGHATKIVEFAEVAGGDGPKRGENLTDPHAIARAATEFAEAEARAGRSVSTADAVAHVTSPGGIK